MPWTSRPVSQVSNGMLIIMQSRLETAVDVLRLSGLSVCFPPLWADWHFTTRMMAYDIESSIPIRRLGYEADGAETAVLWPQANRPFTSYNGGKASSPCIHSSQPLQYQHCILYLPAHDSLVHGESQARVVKFTGAGVLTGMTVANLRGLNRPRSICDAGFSFFIFR